MTDFNEEQVNEMLGAQKAKYETALREQSMDFRLEHIDSNLSSVKDKVCKHVEDDKLEKEKILGAITDMGRERRQCEERVNNEIKELNDYNHNTFVKKSDLKMYAFLIVFAVSATVSVINYYGPQKQMQVSDNTVNAIARTILKELGR